MLDKKIQIYYFSGTGNTLKLVDYFIEILKTKGYIVEAIPMEKAQSVVVAKNTTLGLMIPVAMQSTYPLVWAFINSLPNVAGNNVFMLDTMEIFSGGIVGPIKKVLSKKGYNCIGAREFKMSSSFNTNPAKVEKGKIKNIQALKDVEQYANDLIQGTAKWGRVAVISDVMRGMSKSRSMWNLMSKKITITDACIRCKICINSCPVEAMSMRNGKVVIDHLKCNACMRCISKCPKNAILFNKKQVILS